MIFITTFFESISELYDKYFPPKRKQILVPIPKNKKYLNNLESFSPLDMPKPRNISNKYTNDLSPYAKARYEANILREQNRVLSRVSQYDIDLQKRRDKFNRLEMISYRKVA